MCSHWTFIQLIFDTEYEPLRARLGSNQNHHEVRKLVGWGQLLLLLCYQLPYVISYDTTGPSQIYLWSVLQNLSLLSIIYLHVLVLTAT